MYMRAIPMSLWGGYGEILRGWFSHKYNNQFIIKKRYSNNTLNFNLKMFKLDT